MQHDDRTPTPPNEETHAERPVPETSSLKIKSKLRAGARDGRIFEADEESSTDIPAP